MKRSASVLARCVKSLATCLLLSSTFALGGPIEWTNTVGGAWSLADNWSGGVVPDAADVAVLFGSAIAAPATVTLDGPRAVGDVTFNSAAAYTLAGSPLTLNKSSGTSTLQVSQGSHTIASDISPASTVLSAVTDPGAALTLAGSLSGTSAKRLEKTGEGTLTLSSCSNLFAGAVVASQGTLALQGVTLSGALSVPAEGTVSALSTGINGLMGYYYDVTPDGNNFSSYDLMERHFANLTPSLAVPSSAAGTAFDFGADGSKFPFPYGSGGTRTTNFEAVWRGTITLPENTYYFVRALHDDALVIAIDRQQVFVNTGNATDDFMTYLTAGTHDIVIGLSQGIGEYGLQIQVHTLADSTFMMLPNALLSPYTSVGSLSGSGAVSLAESASLNAVQRDEGLFSGTMTGATGSSFTKNGFGTLTLSSDNPSNALAGSVAVANGTLALAAPERFGNVSTVSVASRSALQLYADETLGALSGAGTVTLGGWGYTYSTSFSGGESDSGISASKTYTHLLDFGASDTPAAINGATFTAAAMSGSANGYGWSTVNAPGGWWLDNGGSDMANLLTDFYHGSTDYTLTLTGLAPGKSYETRFYFKSWGPVGARYVTFAFTAGNAFVGSIDHDLNAVAFSIVGCRYTADAAGNVQIHVISRSDGDTCHLYGMTNEEAPALTADSSAGPGAAPDVVAFSGDADSTLSARKVYTHLLDFPNNGNPASVNGVTFTSADMSGSANGYSWSTTGAPTGTWNDGPNDSTRLGVDRLLWDFCYNSNDFTLTLSGLHPGQTYETHLYFRYFGSLVPDSPRDITATFTAGSTLIGSVNHDLDTVERSMIRCRYTADAAGTVSIRVVSADSGSTCHVYGLSNEEVLSLPTLTLDTPAGQNARHTGAINGFGLVVKQGDGAQAFGGADTVPTPIDVRAGTLVLQPGASIASGVVVRAGATLSVPDGSVFIGGLQGTGTFSLDAPTAGQASLVYITDDASTGISTNKVYTHLLDFGTRLPSAVINGVSFNKVSASSGTINGYGWSDFPSSSHGGDGNFSGVPTDSGLYNLLYDMNYGLTMDSYTPATMQLTGLTPGKRYEVHFFNRSWGWGGNRTQTLTFDPDGEGPVAESVMFNPDSLLPNYVSCRYTAVSSVLNITLLSTNPDGNMSLHLYGLSNEEVSEAPAVVYVVTDSVLGGPITGGGNWAKTGPAKLTVTNDSSTAWGAIAVNAGALGMANGGCATLGPVVVADGATLFGDGRIGGDVSVSSNAWLMAGSASACGTLQIGGALTLAPGVQLPWRFDTVASDAFTVGGLLTFPTNGVVLAEALATGLTLPARTLLFSSSQAVNGPADLAGWTVEGVKNASLTYSADRTAIYVCTPRGTLFMLQ